MRQDDRERIEALQKRREQIDNRLRALQARQRRQERKDDTRRKIIAGALALEHRTANPGSEFATLLLRLLDRYVTRPADRALFPDLRPLPGSAPVPVTGDEGKGTSAARPPVKAGAGKSG